MGQRIGTPHQLRHAIGQSLPPLLWISGDELLLVIEAADLVRAQARKQGFDEREVVDIDARFDRSHLIEATQSTSLFASRRLIDLRLNVKPTKELGEALRDLLPRLDDDTRIMVSSQHLEKATTSTTWFEALARQMLWMETPRIDVASLGKWIAERLAAQKQQASPPVLALITERTEGNLLAAHQAIQRLGLLLPPGELPADAVADIVLDSARFELFGLVDAALAGEPARALRMARSLAAEDAAMPLLVWALGDALRKLLRIQQALQLDRVSMQQAMRSAGVFGKRETVMRRALARLDIPTLQQLLQHTAVLDRMAKGVGGSLGSPWFQAETLLVAMAGGRLPGPLDLTGSLTET